MLAKGTGHLEWQGQEHCSHGAQSRWGCAGLGGSAAGRGWAGQHLTESRERVPQEQGAGRPWQKWAVQISQEEGYKEEEGEMLHRWPRGDPMSPPPTTRGSTRIG